MATDFKNTPQDDGERWERDYPPFPPLPLLSSSIDCIFDEAFLSVYFQNLSLISELSQKELERGETLETVDKINAAIESIEKENFIETSTKSYHCPVCDKMILQQRKTIHGHLDRHSQKILASVREGEKQLSLQYKKYFIEDT